VLDPKDHTSLHQIARSPNSKAFDVLLFLAQNPNRLITRTNSSKGLGDGLLSKRET